MKYTKTHEWVREEGNMVTVGITDHAQEELSDVVHVELPKEGAMVEQGKPMMVVESVKAASDIYAPVSGKIEVVNEALLDNPEMINSGAESDGWLVKITPSNMEDVTALLDHSGYQEIIAV